MGCRRNGAATLMATYNICEVPRSMGGLTKIVFPRALYNVARYGDLPPEGTNYVNRAYDAVAVAFVRWTTAGAADPTGVEYPGPGVFGATALDYCVESLIR